MERETETRPRIRPSGTKAREWPWLVAVAALYIAAAFGVGAQRGLYFVTAACLIAGWALYWRLLRSPVRSTPWAMWPFGICLLPAGLFFLFGAISYLAGKPSFVVIGSGYGPSYQYLDERYRFEYHVHFADGDNSAVILLCTYPNNAAVSCMAMLLGPPRGAYDGPYPSFAEAARLLAERGQPVSVSELPELAFIIAGTKIMLEPGSRGSSLAMLDNLARNGMLSGMLLDGRCAIFGSKDEQPLRQVFYVDAVKQRFLARVHAPPPAP